MSWKAQFERMLRSLDRIQDRDKPSELYVDDLVHFFMDCWHLKDWIYNDARHLHKKKRVDIRDAAHKADILQVCRDIANRSKHLTRRKRERYRRRNVRLLGAHKLYIQGEVGTFRTDYVIVGERRKQPEPVLRVAQQAVDEWKKILTDHKLRLPK